MSRELMEALDILEKEKNISKVTLLEAIEQSLIQACKNHFGKADNVHVYINPENCDFSVMADRAVVETVEDPALEISLVDAQKIDSSAELGDVVKVEIHSREFGRIATQNAKNVILQKIREEERKVLFDQYYGIEKDVVTGIVQRVVGKNVSINLGKVDAILNENEQVKGETFKPTERIKVYILEVKDTSKGPRILVSRTHPGLVKRLFESEVAEVKDGTVEIKCIAREAGSRTKIAVWSNDPDVDPVGACVGINGIRVNAIVNELRGEKIDIINWDENPAILIENALSPAKVIAVMADPDEKTALVVVPDYQLSLAIGKEGQNARLAARLTGFKIDIKSETQARESGDFYEYEDDEYGYYDENGQYIPYDDEDYEEGEYPEDEYAQEDAPEGAYDGEYAQEDVPEGAYDGEYAQEETPEGVSDESIPEEPEDGSAGLNDGEDAEYSEDGEA
ncbi:MAG: transcription termination/antitermination protein NusA [Blautia sp.]|nr:transcription termination/antitermination protein NusA [Blautia sp.]